MAEGGARILQTADNALRILTLLGESMGPRSLADIARALDLAKSVTYTLLFTLKQRGFVEQDPQTRLYSLGLRLVALGHAAAKRLDLRAISRPYMVELATLTAESVYLMVPGRNVTFLLDRVDPTNPMRVTMEVGQEGYFHSGASNKALMAFLPDEEVARIIRDAGLIAITPTTVTDPVRLWADLREARRLGYAYSAQETFEGIAGLAAPVFNARGALVASVGIAGLIQRVAPMQAEWAVHVLRAADRISRDLGFGSPHEATPLPSFTRSEGDD